MVILAVSVAVPGPVRRFLGVLVVVVGEGLRRCLLGVLVVVLAEGLRRRLLGVLVVLLAGVECKTAHDLAVVVMGAESKEGRRA